MTKGDFSKIKVRFVPEGKTVKIRGLKNDYAPELTEFNFAVVEFGHLFDSLRNKTMPLFKRKEKTSKNLRILLYEQPRLIKPAIKTIIKLANLPYQAYRNSKSRFLYQKSLAKIYRPMVQESRQRRINNTLALLLERGALLIGAFYHYPHDCLARIIAKRLDYKNGEFGLGLSNLILPKGLKRFKVLHIQEDCIATGNSIAGTVLALKEEGLFFNEIQIDAAVASQTGAEFLQNYLKYLGVKKATIKTGALCFKLDNRFYLKKNGQYFVGDMGKWSQILPKRFDRVAWWNKNRLDYQERVK